MPLRPGERFGRYELGELLGKGGMGEVYSAYDTILQRRIALKVLLPSPREAFRSSASGTRILREARAAARITHPNAVAIFDVGEMDTVPFIAMEYVSGRTLRAYVGDAGVPLARRLRWLIGIARGLGAAHQLGLVHRDVKPDNVIVGDDDSVKVLDFGIALRTVTPDEASSAGGEAGSAERYASVLGTLTAQGILVGTPRYMSPEQMRGDALDGRADEFSWGVLAYEVLTGKPPWEGTGLALVSQILSREIESLQGSVPGLPARADAVVRIALSKSPGGRFATMEEVAEELEAHAAVTGEGEDRAPGAILASDPMSLAPTQRVEVAIEASLSPRNDATTVPRLVKRSRARVAGSAAAVAAVVLVVGGVWGSRVLAQHRAPRAPLDAAAVVEAPSQMSANAEATAAYVAGMRALHDAAMGAAWKQLNRAIELDPLFAAARLRRALLRALNEGLGGFTSEFKEDLQQARNARASLGGHDRLLLGALEPWVQVPPDLAESQRRLEAAGKSHPADADFPFELGLVLDVAMKPAEAAAAFRVALARDPSFALSWRAIGPERLALDDVAGAIEAYDQCVKVSPGATSCLADLAILQSNEGKCEELVSTSRRLISLAPDSPGTYRALADGLLGSGEPVDAVRVALGEEWDRESPAERRVSQLEDEASLAILRGDFAAAERQYAERERLAESAPDDASHFSSSYGRMLLDLEVGRPAQAAKLADLYLRRRAAWSAAGDFDLTIFAYVIELAGRGIDRERFNALRDQWLQRNPDGSGFRWIEAYAAPVETLEDATAALAAKPDQHPLITPLSMTPSFTEPLGRTYLVAGRLEEAIRYLSQASTSCLPLVSSTEAIPATRAAFELGQALEANGDRSGACSAYQGVVRRWGSAVPASLTASKSLGRIRSLGCAQ